MQLRELTSRIKFIVARMSQWQELEAAGHTTSVIRKQRERNECQRQVCFLLSVPSRAQAQGAMLPPFTLGPPPQLTYSR